MDKLMQGDCIELMADIPSKSVDCIITSPPYNMNLRVINGRYTSRCRNRNHKIEFATKYENYNDDLSMEEYFNFQKDFLKECLRISKLTFYNTQMITGNKVALMKLCGEFAENIKEIIVWDKCISQPAMKYNTLNSQYEFIFVLDAEKPYNRMFEDAYFERGTESNVWKIKPHRKSGFKASFPEELVERIIDDFTISGQVVCDPFMGSGTTGVVCARKDRNFIGIEYDKKTFLMAKKNIEEAHNVQLKF